MSTTQFFLASGLLLTFVALGVTALFVAPMDTGTMLFAETATK